MVETCLQRNVFFSPSPTEHSVLVERSRPALFFSFSLLPFLFQQLFLFPNPFGFDHLTIVMDILICINIAWPQLLHYHINTMNAQFYGTIDGLNCVTFWILYLKQETNNLKKKSLHK